MSRARQGPLKPKKPIKHISERRTGLAEKQSLSSLVDDNAAIINKESLTIKKVKNDSIFPSFGLSGKDLEQAKEIFNEKSYLPKDTSQFP